MGNREFAEDLLEVVIKYNDEFPEQASILNTIAVATLVEADIVISMLARESQPLDRALTIALFQAHPEFLNGFKEWLDERGLEYDDENVNKFSGMSQEQIDDLSPNVFSDFIDSLGS